MSANPIPLAAPVTTATSPRSSFMASPPDEPLAAGPYVDVGYLANKPSDTFVSLGDAYALLATAIANQSPKTAAEPANFEAKK